MYGNRRPFYFSYPGVIGKLVAEFPIMYECEGCAPSVRLLDNKAGGIYAAGFDDSYGDVLPPRRRIFLFPAHDSMSNPASRS